jgi:cephalosporin hydroxylase
VDAVASVGAARAVGRAQPQTLDEAIDFVTAFEYGGVELRPMQIASELRALLELLAQAPPRTVLEIGTGRGGTLFLFASVAQPDALLVSIDDPSAEGMFGGKRAYKRRAHLYRALGTPGQRVVFFAADSHSDATHARVVEALGGERLDFLFIDGDHTREGVEADFRMYSTLVRSGGLVAFHDIVPGPEEFVGGVPDFWQSVRDGNAVELVEDWNQRGFGIGVLRL